MRHIVLFLACLIPMFAFSQTEKMVRPQPTDDCGIITTEQDNANEQRLRAETEEFWNALNTGTEQGQTFTRWIDVKCISVRRTNGLQGVTAATIDSYIAAFNAKTNYTTGGNFYNTKLRRCGSVKRINSTQFWDFDMSEEAALRNLFFRPRSINIYFVDRITRNGGELCGYAYYPNNFPDGAGFSIIDRDCGEKTFVHEVGHALSLRHTHDTYNGRELVTRNTSIRNCTTAGDGFCDTQADPNVYGLVGFSSCNYFGTARDSRGALYVPDTKNHMSYAPHSCRVKFSPQQKRRMYQTATSIKNQGNRCTPLNRLAGPTDDIMGDEATASTSKMAWMNEELSFQLYPNPATNQVNLKADMSGGAYLENLEIKVYDLTGKMVKAVSVDRMDGQGELNLSLDNLSSGLFMMMISDGARREVIRFTKQ